MTNPDWPELRLDKWSPTYATLHRWTQIVGKTRLALAPFENHWWHCTLYVTTRGMTTSPMPIAGGTLQVDFDLLHDRLDASTSDGRTRSLKPENKSVAEFYREYCAMLETLGVKVRMHAAPNEVPDAIPFAEDREHATYDGDAARRWWRALVHADIALKTFRSGFAGKCSPTHLWWGAFDIACTRFSGRPAPPHPGGIPNCPNFVMAEAYSRECISAGWWPGSAGSPVKEAAFYAYAYPEPDGCSIAPIGPSTAFYQPDMREWILPYEAVRTSADPYAMIAEFLESTYETAARLGGWDIEGLRSSRSSAQRALS